MITMNVSEELISISGFNDSQKSIIVSYLNNLNNFRKVSFVSYNGNLSKLELVRDVMNINNLKRMESLLDGDFKDFQNLKESEVVVEKEVELDLGELEVEEDKNSLRWNLEK